MPELVIRKLSTNFAIPAGLHSQAGHRFNGDSAFRHLDSGSTDYRNDGSFLPEVTALSISIYTNI